MSASYDVPERDDQISYQPVNSFRMQSTSRQNLPSGVNAASQHDSGNGKNRFGYVCIGMLRNRPRVDGVVLINAILSKSSVGSLRLLGLHKGMRTMLLRRT